MPRVKNFSNSVTTITTSASDQLSRLPYSGVPIAGTPPAAYWTPILSSVSPIIMTTIPVTIGGNTTRSRLTNWPKKTMSGS